VNLLRGSDDQSMLTCESSPETQRLNLQNIVDADGFLAYLIHGKRMVQTDV